MIIRITGARRAPSWETTQAFVREALGDYTARLTRIEYRELGNYTLTLQDGNYDPEEIRLEVQ
jgi:hypothetical protein